MKFYDMLGRPLKKGDYVISYNNVYEVVEFLNLQQEIIKILLVDKSKNTKSVRRRSTECVIVDTDDVLIWKLKRGY